MTATAAEANVVSYPLIPDPEPLKGTLLDAATYRDGIKWLDGAALAETYSCLRFRHEADFCETPGSESTKTLDQTPAWLDGMRFALYGGVTCKTIGSGVRSFEDSRVRDETEKVFNRGESTGVEQAVMEHLFVANTGVDTIPGQWAAPTDVNAAGAVHPRVAVALLEEHAASIYVGVPTIHMPRSIASLLLLVGALEYDGNQLRTKLGSKVAAGAGYAYPNTSPAGAAAAAGERWVYATGEIIVLGGQANIRQAIATSTNDLVVLAEKAYIASNDCYSAAIRATVAP